MGISGRLLLLLLLLRRRQWREREAGGVELEAVVGRRLGGLSRECGSVGEKGSFH